MYKAKHSFRYSNWPVYKTMQHNVRSFKFLMNRLIRLSLVQTHFNFTPCVCVCVCVCKKEKKRNVFNLSSFRSV